MNIELTAVRMAKNDDNNNKRSGIYITPLMKQYIIFSISTTSQVHLSA
jgi:hypothetical protein